MTNHSPSRRAGPRWALCLLLTLAASLAVVTASLAGHGACARCGRHAPCQQVCRLVPEDRKITVTCWGCKCEEFCVGGPSHVACKGADEACLDCVGKEPPDPKPPFSLPRSFTWREWIPGCPQAIYTRKRLMRKTETKTVPGFKWVVEDVCAECQSLGK
jgi:hypothetical protein